MTNGRSRPPAAPAGRRAGGPPRLRDAALYAQAERSGIVAALDDLVGRGWAKSVPILASGTAYATRIEAAGGGDGALLRAHPCMRQLADLNGRANSADLPDPNIRQRFSGNRVHRVSGHCRPQCVHLGIPRGAGPCRRPRRGSRLHHRRSRPGIRTEYPLVRGGGRGRSRSVIARRGLKSLTTLGYRHTSARQPRFQPAPDPTSLQSAYGCPRLATERLRDKLSAIDRAHVVNRCMMPTLMRQSVSRRLQSSQPPYRA